MSYKSPIIMDQALSYPRIVLCIKPHEKKPIRRETTIFPKVSKMAIIRKKGKKLNFQKWPIFWLNLKRIKKIGIKLL